MNYSPLTTVSPTRFYVLVSGVRSLNDDDVMTWDEARAAYHKTLNHLRDYPVSGDFTYIPNIQELPIDYVRPTKSNKFTPQLKKSKRTAKYVMPPLQQQQVKQTLQRRNKGKKRSSMVACTDVDRFTKDFGSQLVGTKPTVGKLICALCYAPLERIAAIFGELFETITHIRTIDANGFPVGRDVPKYVKACLCYKCFREHDNELVGDTGYKSFNALTVSNPVNSISMDRRGRGHQKDDIIPSTQQIDPHDDQIDGNAVNYVLRGGANVSPDTKSPNDYLNWKANRYVRRTSRSGGLSPSIGRNVEPETVQLKDSPSTKRFREFIEEIKSLGKHGD